MAAQLKDAFQGAVGLRAHELPPAKSRRSQIVDKVSRNAVAELVNQSKTHPQRGDLASSNPAYVALAALSENYGRPALALGLRNETGEITFMDFNMAPEKVAQRGGAHLDRADSRHLWRQLKKLVAIEVDRNMLGPRKRLISPEEIIPEELVLEDSRAKASLPEPSSPEE
jgi:hypothetical protein